MENQAHEVLPLLWKVTLGFLVMGAGYYLARLVRVGVERAVRGRDWANQFGTLLTTTLFYIIITVSVMVGVSTIGIDITPLIASLGLGGFALGFALRDAVSNLLAGVLIVVYRPFVIGDHLSVAGASGRVREINLRYTIIDSEEGEELIPNQVIFNTRVTVKRKQQDGGSD